MTTIPLEIYIFFKKIYPSISSNTDIVEFYPDEWDTELLYMVPEQTYYVEDIDPQAFVPDVQRTKIYRYGNFRVAYVQELDRLYVERR